MTLNWFVRRWENTWLVLCSWILPVVTEKESRKKFYMKLHSSRQTTGRILLCPQSDHPSCHGLCGQGLNHSGDISGSRNSGSTMSKPKKNFLGKNNKCSGHLPKMVPSRLYSTLSEKQKKRWKDQSLPKTVATPESLIMTQDSSWSKTCRPPTLASLVLKLQAWASTLAEKCIFKTTLCPRSHEDLIPCYSVAGDGNPNQQLIDDIFLVRMKEIQSNGWMEGNRAAWEIKIQEQLHKYSQENSPGWLVSCVS